MGYSKNPSSIEKVEKFLALMVNANESLEWETPNPDRLAYYIREGISASSILYKSEPGSDKLKEFSALKSKFIIKIKGSFVLAELRSETPFAVMGVKRLKSVYLPSVTTLTEIVGAVAKYIIEESKEQIRIPNSDLLEDEFRKLETYLKSKELKTEVSGNELVISKSVN
ncbi:hypothetical protein LCGC14_2998980 [marine sediment metagenome]|uniref:Uncharacterized protein n=1 Tax=marine sediment metagenome TaxID=412755 RepID=A0A0F8Z979_9ZZZZ